MPRVKELKDTYLKKDLYKYLLWQRKDKKITQEQIARELGVTQTWYSRKEKNADFTYSELLIIFRIVGAETKEILKLFGR